MADLPSKEYDSVTEADLQRHALMELFIGDPMNNSAIGEVARIILENAPVDEEFSANSVRRHMPTHVKPGAIGMTFWKLRERGYIRQVNDEASTKRNTHGKPVGVYKLVDPAKRLTFEREAS